MQAADAGSAGHSHLFVQTGRPVLALRLSAPVFTFCPHGGALLGITNDCRVPACQEQATETGSLFLLLSLHASLLPHTLSTHPACYLTTYMVVEGLFLTFSINVTSLMKRHVTGRRDAHAHKSCIHRRDFFTLFHPVSFEQMFNKPI